MSDRNVDPPRSKIDWGEAYRRLQEVEKLARSDAVPEAVEVQRVLEARARALAARPPAADTEARLDVVAFSLGRELYAFESGYVAEVFRLSGRSALPGALPPVAGVTAHRGELLTLLDLRSTLGLSAAALDDLSRVIVLRRGTTRVGVLVDRVDGLRAIARSELRPAAARGGTPNEYLLGVTADLLAVLDADALLRLFDGGDAP